MPALTPETTPEPEPMVAILVLPLTQVPPEAASVNDVVAPTQTVFVPEIADGAGLTVTVIVR